jgi:hypothetical protein
MGETKACFLPLIGEWSILVQLNNSFLAVFCVDTDQRVYQTAFYVRCEEISCQLMMYMFSIIFCSLDFNFRASKIENVFQSESK